MAQNPNPIPTYFNPEIGPQYRGLSFEDVANSFNNGQQFSNQIQEQQQKGLLSRLLAQSTGQDGKVDLNKALEAVQSNPNQAYQPALVNTLSGLIQQQEAARIKAQQDALKSDADINKTYAETGKIKQEGINKSLENGNIRQGAIKDVFQAAALTGSKNTVLLGLNAAFKSGLMDADAYNQQVQFVDTMTPAQIQEYARGNALGNKDAAPYLFQTMNNAADNATSRANNTATVGATIRGQDITAQTADKNRELENSKFNFQKQQDFFNRNKPVGFGTDINGRKYAIMSNGEPRYLRNEQGEYIIEQNNNAALVTSQREENQRIQKIDALLPEIEKLLPNATSSYLGAGADWLGRTVGYSTPGAQATAQLKTLAGQLVALQPKMSGPQSDKDVAMYKQMAGQLDDDTLPIQTRLSALKTIRDLNEKYKNLSQQTTSQPQSSNQNLFKLFD